MDLSLLRNSFRSASLFGLAALWVLAAWAPSAGASSGHEGASSPLSLSQALSDAFSHNPEIASFEARAEAEDRLVRSRYAPSSPRIGLMREVDMNYMQQDMGPMNSWTISQEILFPTKYFTMGTAQKARAGFARQEALDRKLEVRQRVLSSYYGLYAARRIHLLLEAQRETLREIARIAEARRATGAVPQQDEMKAHVEQTKLENELLVHGLEIVETQARLNALLGREADEEIVLPKEELPIPRLSLDSKELLQKVAEGSKAVQAARWELEEKFEEKSLAKQGYLPDFMLSYRKPFTNSPSSAYQAGIELTVPLWFFLKETSEVSAAGARVIEAEKKAELALREAKAEAKAAAGKVEAYEKLIRIYESSLIPQAQSTLNSSRTAYGAGKSGFLELLDSERSLYSVRIDYYQTLARFVENVAQLERVSGSKLSSLPFEGKENP